jgi:hypothetical protein
VRSPSASADPEAPVTLSRTSVTFDHPTIRTDIS